MNALPKSVRIVEVGPRDGLQNEKTVVPAADKVAFVNMLSKTGLKYIEVASFVGPKLKQMADGDQVFPAVDKVSGITFGVLTPNIQGFNRAVKAGAREVAVFASATEAFSQSNLHCSIDDSFEMFKPVLAGAKQNGMTVRGYVSCVLGCPYEGEVKPEAVIRVARKLLDMGCYEVSLGDTIGVGAPDGTHALLRAVKGAGIPASKLAGHFHDTQHRALDNIRAAMEEGVSVFDSSASGLGGCPYAPGASGNVATESVLIMMDSLGVETGVDVGKVAAAGRFVRGILGKPAGP